MTRPPATRRGFWAYSGIRSPSAAETTRCLCGHGFRLGSADGRLGLACGAPKPRKERFYPPPSGTRVTLYDEPQATLADALAAGARGARHGNPCGVVQRTETMEVPRAFAE